MRKNILFSLKNLFSSRVHLIVLLVLYLSACSGVYADNIKWVDEINVFYPEKLYLTGLGIGETKEKADNRAFQNISKSIKLHIKSEEFSKEEYYQTDSGENSHTFNYDENIQIESETVLENASIVKHGYDSTKEMYYSLAVLRKDKYSDILSSKIEESKENTNRLLIAIKKEDSKVIKLGDMFRLHMESAIQQNAYTVLRTVSDNYSLHKPQPNLFEVQRMIDQFLLNEFVFSLRINGDMADEIKMIMGDVLTTNGYYISTDSGKESDVIIKGNMSIRKMPSRRDRWVILSWKFDLSFIESRNEAVILRYTLQDRQQQPSVEMARDRILYNFGKEYAEEIAARFKQKLLHTR